MTKPGLRKKVLPSPLELAWQTAVFRVRGFATAADMWLMMLSSGDRDRLGGDLEAAYRTFRGTAGMWMMLRGVSRARAVVDVGVGLNLIDSPTGRWLLRESGEATGNVEFDRESGIAAAALVLSERPRQAFWRGDAIDIDWDKRSAPWDFFWKLGEAAKAGGAVDRLDFGETDDAYSVSKQASRLTRLAGFPPDLAVKIVGAGRGTTRLDLPAAEVRIFLSEAGMTREWLPGRT
jgi:hypothetical protein